jgi:uncharacterized membrane protein YgaE (UPF0421/DUF939 family)
VPAYLFFNGMGFGRVRFMDANTKNYLIYASKCVVGTIMVFIFASNYKNMSWSLISVMLVLSPEGDDTITLALNRIKANFIGAAVGLLCLLMDSTSVWLLCLGLVVSLGICYFFKLENGARSSLSATIIVMLHEEGKHFWNTALDRVIAVVAGCLLGLVITFVFHNLFKKKKAKSQNAEQIE